MSRTTKAIKNINNELEKISGLDGIVAEIVVIKEKEIKAMVKLILEAYKEDRI